MKAPTRGPVPVGGCTGEAAFVFEGRFERVNIPTVPGKKQPCEMDLFENYIYISTDARELRDEKPHDVVQVHMHIHNVWRSKASADATTNKRL